MGNGYNSVNYANINAGIEFLKGYQASQQLVSSQDFVVVVPFVEQAAKWVAQLRIQGPGNKVTVVTIGASQGNASKLVLFDLTLAKKSEGGTLGFLKDFS